MSHPVGKSFSEFFETVVLQSEQDIITAQTREYYADFFNPKYFVRADILSSKTLQGVGEKFTVYVIQIELPFTKYTIEKRYNLFFDLYKKIETQYKNLDLQSTTFPAKKIFGSFAQTTIEHRKLHLNKFLHFLSEHYKKEEMVEFLEFLEIKKRLEMMKRNQMYDPIPKFADNAEKFSLDDQQALTYLTLFNKKPKVLSNSFKEFEYFFIEKRPKRSKIAIKKLFYGDDQLNGLIHICGRFDVKSDSHLTCGSGLNLIVKLLDYEYNKEAEFYNQIFGSTNYRDIMCLYFEEHIKGKGFKPCKVAALKLLYIFMNHNPNMSISSILQSEETIQEYETWKTQQSTTSIKAENYNKI